MIIEFPRKLNLALYYLHNRHHGQPVHVWKSGPEFAFTFPRGCDRHPPAGHYWDWLGELVWWVEGDHFVHEVVKIN
jgi:hypothetical protein